MNSFTITHKPGSGYTVYPTDHPQAAAVYDTIEEAFDAIRSGFDNAVQGQKPKP